ncbi:MULTISPECIES: DUF1822 family protein [unclassified Microcoleus]|uniref:DUF1822 family protein n=1 Tax=unclassified Microcoleus TaxID=2642155 RepID=UPI002FD23BE1
MKDNWLEFPINQQVYNLALGYASEQANLEVGLKHFYNTMTVWAVNHLIGWMDFETILDKDCDWDVAIESALELADLELPGIGKIQCCRISEGETKICVPALNDRIAYIFVELPDSLDKATLLGFISAADIDNNINGDTVQISVADLQPFECLADYLQTFELQTV